MSGFLQITSKTPQSHLHKNHTVNSVYHTEASTSSASSSSFDSSGSNFLCMTLFNKNFRFSTANAAVSSKSMSSSSMKRRRVFMTLRCVASSLIR